MRYEVILFHQGCPELHLTTGRTDICHLTKVYVTTLMGGITKREYSHLCFPGGRKGPAHSRCSKFFLIHGIDLRVKAKVATGSLTALSGTQLKHNKERVLSISSSFTKKTKKTQYWDWNVSYICYGRATGSLDNDVSLKKKRNFTALCVTFRMFLQRDWFSRKSSDHLFIGCRVTQFFCIPNAPGFQHTASIALSFLSEFMWRKKIFKNCCYLEEKHPNKTKCFLFKTWTF